MTLIRQAPPPQSASDLERQLADFERNFAALRQAIAAGDVDAITASSSKMEQAARGLSMYVKALRAMSPGPQRAALRRTFRNLLSQLREARSQLQLAQAGTLRGLHALFGQSELHPAYSQKPDQSPTASLPPRRLGSA